MARRNVTLREFVARGLRAQAAVNDVLAGAWVAKVNGLGTCFHQALDRWTALREIGVYDFKVAVGIVRSTAENPGRHVHAWLESGELVMSAVNGAGFHRLPFYEFVGIEPDTVRRVNPRSLLRARGGVIDREPVRLLLEEAGIAYKVIDGGIMAA